MLIFKVAQIKIRPEEMSQLKKPLSQVKVAKVMGDGYAGGIEVFHQASIDLSI
jgi:hypothetical protein